MHRNSLFCTMVIAVLSGLITAPVIALPIPIENFRYSLDPSSPTTPGTVTPDDVLMSDPNAPSVSTTTEGTDLGLNPDVNLNALSFGKDDIFNKDKYGFREEPLIKFSVDRTSVGMTGTDVNTQATLGGSAAADIFGAFSPPFTIPNELIYDESELGLTSAGMGDNIDALATLWGTFDFIYFSIDSASATGIFAGFANDILISAGDGTFTTFANAENMGLAGSDDLDALVLFDSPDAGTKGVLDPGIDMALFSLSRTSASTFSTDNTYNPGVQGFLSPADILLTDFQGSFSLWAEASELGLLPTDNIDALAAPEPGTFSMFGIGVLGIIGYGYRRRKKAAQSKAAQG